MLACITWQLQFRNKTCEYDCLSWKDAEFSNEIYIQHRLYEYIIHIIFI